MTTTEAIASLALLPHNGYVTLWTLLENGHYVIDRSHAKFYGELVAREWNEDFSRAHSNRSAVLFPQYYNPNTETFWDVA